MGHLIQNLLSQRLRFRRTQFSQMGFIRLHTFSIEALRKLLNLRRQYRLTPQQVAIANDHLYLVNNERAPIAIDFKVIADALRHIGCVVFVLRGIVCSCRIHKWIWI
jgi:hypothetical protein